MALKVLTLPLLAVRLMLDLARETPALPSGIVTTLAGARLTAAIKSRYSRMTRLR
jgi:hypothetical protein